MQSRYSQKRAWARISQAIHQEVERMLLGERYKICLDTIDSQPYLRMQRMRYLHELGYLARSRTPMSPASHLLSEVCCLSWSQPTSVGATMCAQETTTSSRRLSAAMLKLEWNAVRSALPAIVCKQKHLWSGGVPRPGSAMTSAGEVMLEKVMKQMKGDMLGE
eukprot:752768-Hanusia_phi.AAC.3